MRLPFFDSFRGICLILMAMFHFCFDLNVFGVLHENFNSDPFWLNIHALGVGVFTALAGIGYYLGNASYRTRGFWIRFRNIFICSLIISVVTYFMTPNSWIFFGVLHCNLIVSLFAPWLIRFPRFCLPLGILFVAIPHFYRDIWFNKSFLIMTGLSPLKPVTDDFAPLLPWFGTACIGIFIGYLFRENDFKLGKYEWRPLSVVGEHPLIFYMTHQLLLYPLAWLIADLIR